MRIPIPTPPNGPKDGSERAARMVATFAQLVPHNRALGIRFVSVSGGRVTLALPYDERLVGNPLTGTIHFGAVAAMLDAACGSAVLVALADPVPVATLDLRIDCLRPSIREKELYARAECYRVTQHVAFVRCESFHEDDDAGLVAVANATFMVFRDRVLPSGFEAP